jgi:hypothetical protein
VVTPRRFLREVLRVEALRRGSLTVLIASALRSCRVRLDRTRYTNGKHTPLATRAFADGPAVITRVEYAARPDGHAKRTGVLTSEHVDWTRQAITDHLRGLSNDTDDAWEALHNHGSHAPGEHASHEPAQVGVPAPEGIPACSQRMPSVSLKVGGIEKARVTLYPHPEP